MPETNGHSPTQSLNIHHSAANLPKELQRETGNGHDPEII